ncbi:uncharacterized protein LOC109002250 isoform X2 [Juglans regia]|nr:uncharacterized protein LOC109002250 isoform X2 [Juglans regia]
MIMKTVLLGASDAAYQLRTNGLRGELCQRIKKKCKMKENAENRKTEGKKGSPRSNPPNLLIPTHYLPQISSSTQASLPNLLCARRRRDGEAPLPRGSPLRATVTVSSAREDDEMARVSIARNREGLLCARLRRSPLCATATGWRGSPLRATATVSSARDSDGLLCVDDPRKGLLMSLAESQKNVCCKNPFCSSRASYGNVERLSVICLSCNMPQLARAIIYLGLKRVFPFSRPKTLPKCWTLVESRLARQRSRYKKV